MNIRKIFVVLCGLLLTAQTMRAQENMYVLGSNGKVDAISTSQVEYATFNTDGIKFTITNDGIEATTSNFISASCTVALPSESAIKKLTVAPTIGVCYSWDNSIPTINYDCITIGKEFKSYTFKLSSLIPGTTYYYRVYIQYGDKVYYGDVCSAKTLGTKPEEHCNTTDINGHKFVDLGLPSGLLWATCNVGAESSTDDGCYYAWGETTTKKTYDLNTYKYYSSSSSSYTKYTSTDCNTFLENSDDAAYVNWGSPCRMPTQVEFAELRNTDNCTWAWTSLTTSSGKIVKGCLVISVKNNNSIFLPASGIRYESLLLNHGSNGYYWSSTLDGYNTDYACSLGFSGNFGKRCHGLTVRPVAEKNSGGSSYKIINGHKFINLGLPSGLLWATCNIGAEAATDDGNYYAWGETATKDTYNWSTYKYGSSYDNMTKYNSTDGKTVLENSDDAAYVNWGSSCRMPTRTEFDELCNKENCTWIWTSKTTSSNETINGYEVTSKKNGNSIFLPASGYRYGSYLYYHGSRGYYWSSALYSSGTSVAYGLNFLSGYFSSYNYSRYYGHTVRPVAEP